MKIESDCNVSANVYSDRLIFLKDIPGTNKRTTARQLLMLENRKATKNGFLSKMSIRKIKMIVSNWNESINAYNYEITGRSRSSMRHLVFATLTLCSKQVHSDKEIKRSMLNRFLIYAKRSLGIKHYLWTAEKQKNGNIHFHIILDNYIDKKLLTDSWNSIMADFGYMEPFEKKFNHRNPPSCKIKIVESDSMLCSYLAKYISKSGPSEENQGLCVEGQLWGCSDELRKIKSFKLIDAAYLYSEIAKNDNLVMHKYLDSPYFEVYYLNTKQFFMNVTPIIKQEMNKYYFEVYQFLYFNHKPYQTHLSHDRTQIQKIPVIKTTPIQKSIFDIIPDSGKMHQSD